MSARRTPSEASSNAPLESAAQSSDAAESDSAVGSVGIVTPQTYHFDEPLTLECQRVLPSFDLIFETYGTLNQDKSNAILILSLIHI